MYSMVKQLAANQVLYMVRIWKMTVLLCIISIFSELQILSKDSCDKH